MYVGGLEVEGGRRGSRRAERWDMFFFILCFVFTAGVDLCPSRYGIGEHTRQHDVVMPWHELTLG